MDPKDLLNELNTVEINKEYIERPDMPWFQFNEGKFFFPFDQFGGILAGKYEPDQREIGGNDLPGFIFDKVHIAVLSYREAWVKNDEFLGKRYEDGAKKKMQLFCLVKETNEPIPVMFTLSGTVTGDMKVILDTHEKLVLRRAQGLTKNPDLQQRHFWIPIKAGKAEMRGKEKGKQSKVIPPAIDLDQETLLGNDNEAAAMAIYDLWIGQDNQRITEALIAEAVEWAKRWQKRPESGNGNKAPEPVDIRKIWDYAKEKGISEDVVRKALDITGGDIEETMTKLKGLPMTQTDAIAGMNPKEDDQNGDSDDDSTDDDETTEEVWPNA